MQLLDFVTSLPAEEKDIFLNLLEETASIPIAVRGTMMVLTDSEPRLAKRLEEPVREWLEIYKPINNGNDVRSISVLFVANQTDEQQFEPLG